MEMNLYWVVTTRYDRATMDHWQSQAHFREIARNLGLKLKWLSGNSIPAGWLGYNAANPSPGYPIDTHDWMLVNEDDAMLFHLTCGSKITCKEAQDG